MLTPFPPHSVCYVYNLLKGGKDKAPTSSRSYSKATKQPAHKNSSTSNPAPGQLLQSTTCGLVSNAATEQETTEEKLSWSNKKY